MVTRDEFLSVSAWVAALFILVAVTVAWAGLLVFGVWCALQRLT